MLQVHLERVWRCLLSCHNRLNPMVQWGRMSTAVDALLGMVGRAQPTVSASPQTCLLLAAAKINLHLDGFVDPTLCIKRHDFDLDQKLVYLEIL